MTEEKTVRVMDTGHISVKPDTTCLSFSVKAVYKDYEEAFAAAAVGNSAVRDALRGLSLDPESLKTGDFSISKKYKTVKSWNDV